MPGKAATAATALLCALLVAPATATAASRGALSAKTQRGNTANLAVASAAAAKADCANADLEPAPGNLDLIRAATLCLHNQVRAEAGLPALKEHPRLRRAAVAHSGDMVANRYFEHTTPTGVTMADRITKARYARPWEGWSLGENLAWGTGRLATPQGAVDAWLDSPGHRANLLRRTYRDVGIGVVLGVPSGSGAGATYTVDFGVRR